MGGKAKPKKHTAAELQKKADAHKPRGGGAAGKEERKITLKFTCEICKQMMPSLKNLRDHYESKHPKDPFPEEKYASQVTAKEKTAVHHNQASTLKSNKNASKSVRDKLKEQQAAAAICDEAKRKVYTHTGVGGPSS